MGANPSIQGTEKLRFSVPSLRSDAPDLVRYAATMTIPSPFARTPEPPYYAVIFSSRRTDSDEGYGKMAERMVELAGMQSGFLGVESARGPDGFGITVSYWASAEAIAAWKANVEHVAAQEMGMRAWYKDYELRVARVERAYGKPAT